MDVIFSTLLIGIANGTVEAACNPLVTSFISDNKTTKLNHFHLWFPGGIVIGTVMVLVFNKIGIGWQIQVAYDANPNIDLRLSCFRSLDFPVTERVASGVSTGGMYKALLESLVHLYVYLYVRHGYYRAVHWAVD